jgi:hypothetical protein
MISCSNCQEENPNKNSYCGSCGGRIKPVDRRLREDIRSVIADETKQNRARKYSIAMVALAICGVIGYQGLREMVANQVSVLKPAIIKEATARAQSLVDSEVPKALARLEQGAAVRIAADVHRISQQRSQQVEAVWADAEREAKEQHQRLAASYPANLGSNQSVTAQNVSWTPNGFSSGALTLPPVQGLAGFVGIENLALHPSDNLITIRPTTDSLVGNITNTSIITQTTFRSTCVGGVLMFVTDAAGSPLGTVDDCKNQQPAAGSLTGGDGVAHIIKQ